MTKYFVFIVITCFIYLCSCSKRTIAFEERTVSIAQDSTVDYAESEHDSTAYMVIDLKKANSWDIIYLQRNDSTFKVVSRGPRSEPVLGNRSRIEIGKKYNLTLRSFRDMLWPDGYIGYIDCFTLDSITTVCLEPKNGIWDIYETDELLGLYYKKKTTDK